MKAMAVRYQDRYSDVNEFARDLFAENKSEEKIVTPEIKEPENPIQKNDEPEFEKPESVIPVVSNVPKNNPIVKITLFFVIALILIICIIFASIKQTKTNDSTVTDNQTTQSLEKSSDGKGSKEWKLGNFKVNKGDRNVTDDYDELEYGVKVVWFHWQITEGPDDGRLSYKYKITYTDGTSEEIDDEDRDYQVFEVNKRGFYMLDNSPIPPGTMTLEIYNKKTGELLGEDSVTIVE